MNFNGLQRQKFGDSPELIDKISNLIVAGIKTATCSSYNPDSKPVEVGHRVVVLNSVNQPVCVIETIKVDVIPFNKVSDDFARKEGEGDLSLKFWRKEHKRFFRKQGIFSEDMLLLCEEIKVINAF